MIAILGFVEALIVMFVICFVMTVIAKKKRFVLAS
jgi:hypothetical protein